ncbi:MAG: ATP synthase F0 subunit B [Calditrichaeota bacterium]|nr:MAG: ATP synthase F0 subunit B [Calditrichota bacterium]
MNLMNPDPGTLFWTALTFILLMLVLKKIAWGPILQTLEERERRIKEALEKAEAAQKESEQAMEKQREILEAARKEAQEIIAKSRKTAETTKEEIIEKARAEANMLLERSKKEIALEREKAIEEIKKQAVELSIMMASKLIGKSLTKDDHLDLIEESLEKIAEVQ